MNLDQAANYLNINHATLDRWIRQGLMADAGLREEHIDRELLANWAQRHGVPVGDRGATPRIPAADLFADAVEHGAVSHGAPGLAARDAIETALRALALADDVHDSLLEQTLERERLAATGLGRGVAIPHPRQPHVQLAAGARVSVVYLDPPVDWAATDGLPVHTAILVLSPDTRTHLQLLSRVAFALRNPGFQAFLEQSPSRDQLADHLRQISRSS